MTSDAPNNALLLIVAGPAGSGKTTLCDRMLEKFSPNMQRVITSTTRPSRPGEQDRIDYYFFSPEEFEQRVQAGEFYEYADVHIYRYGTLKSEIREKLAKDIDLLLNIDVQGAATYREVAGSDPLLAGHVVSVFIKPKDLKQIEERLIKRGEDPDEIVRRLKTAEEELLQGPLFDYQIESGSKEEDFAALCSIYEEAKRKATER